MKLIPIQAKRACLLAALLFTGASSAWAADNVIPLLTIEDAPLLDAISTLARQASLNFVVDPHVPGACCGPAALIPQPTVAHSWTNMTAQAALRALLTEHKLTIVTNPATTVARIAPINLDVKPVPSSQVGTNTSKMIPLMALEDVPVNQAMTTLGSMMGLDISFDPKLSPPAFDGLKLVSLRWERITPRQALAALLDNYDLTMKEEGSTAQITFKPKGN